MSLFDTHGLALPGAVDNTQRQRQAADAMASSPIMDLTDDGRIEPPAQPDLDPHHDARALVRMVQCPRCSLPLQTPLILPCGNALCRRCLPPLHKRENISYPTTPKRQHGFACPFAGCGAEHSVADCNQDVTLSKVLERIGVEIARCRPITSDTPTLLDERPRWRNVVDSSQTPGQPRSRILSGGRLVATYTMAELGELDYDASLSYQTMSPTGDSYQHLDIAMLHQLTDAVKTELDCHVCYSLMLDPLTTTCGHTFCRDCVARVLRYSSLCPVCRASIAMAPGVDEAPGNKLLATLLLALCPDLVAARVAAAQEELRRAREENVPLFVCTLAYPTMPTFLHVFEPRYRLMMKRAIESGDRKFGMVAYNQRGLSQGELGPVSFMQYGTLLHILQMQVLPDGRSLVESVGVSRFRVKSHGLLDGYVTGNLERVDDVALAEEESIEALERSSLSDAPPGPNASLSALATAELLAICLDFIAKMRARSAPWLRDNVIASYGHPPDDPAIFPYWFASILPIAEDEKYRLLSTTSVRERLKIAAGWIRGPQVQRWSASSGSCVMI